MNYKINLYVEDKTGKKVEDVVKEISVTNHLTAKLIKDIVNEDKYTDIASESLKVFGKELSDVEKVKFKFVQYSIRLK
jgi:predicted transcriptional regulator